LALLVVLLAAVGVVAYLLVDTFAGGFALPDVVGKPVAQAKQILTAKGLVIGTTSNKANPAPTGTVVSTDPAAGTNVSKHAVVNLTVSAGEATVKVPSVVTENLTTAEAVLNGNGLHYRVKFVTSSGEQNIVLEQNPPAGATVRSGSTVTLSIPKPTNQVSVPNLTGLTAQQAAAQLANAGLSVGSQAQACSNSFPSGQVSGSSPPAGSSVGRSASVNLVISSGPCQVVVKNVLGQSSNDAMGVLSGQGLTVTVATTDTCDPSNNGNVVNQSPQAGTQVSLPATETITVCTASSGTTTTTTT
jgi:serine/threonine-protein kinase